MNKKICCCFGHRTVYNTINALVDEAVEYAVSSGYNEFYTGGMGDFDRLFESALHKFRTKHAKSDFKIILIKPYFSNELNTNREYYKSMYDEIIIPDIVQKVHYKSAVTVRNRWMVDMSDLIIAYVTHSYGGAYSALKYAEKKNKEIINIGTS